MKPELPSWTELTLISPELWLVAGMCAVILVPFVKRDSPAVLTATVSAGLAVALYSVVVTLGRFENFGVIFTGMLTVDYFSQFFKILLIVFTLLILVQWWIASRDQTHIYDVPDFLCLMLGAVLGMSLMASASHLLMIFLAIESASLPSYALAGFRKRLRIGSEGALKYVIFGSASSAIMLYGMSLIYGATGTLSLQGIAESAAADGMTPFMAVGLAGMLVGLAFKLSAVPMHFWCPDVFQGAPIEVTTFLSVASKGAAVCLLVRVLHAFGLTTTSGDLAGLNGLAVGVAILGGVTATWGNLIALHQTNIKRLLAYSSIAHAGYMIMAASAIAVTGGTAQTAIGSILFYFFVYVFMNLGAFTVAALIVQGTGTEELPGYTGLMRRCPILAVLMTLFLLSLFGMPGLGGFMGKIYLMKSMADAGTAGFVLIIVLLLNTLISLYYYMRPVYFMTLVTDPGDRPGFSPSGAGLAMVLVCAAALLWSGLNPAAMSRVAREYAVLSVTGHPHSSSQSPRAIPPGVSLTRQVVATDQ